jgi:hypothetical protein
MPKAQLYMQLSYDEMHCNIVTRGRAIADSTKQNRLQVAKMSATIFAFIAASGASLQ